MRGRLPFQVVDPVVFVLYDTMFDALVSATFLLLVPCSSSVRKIHKCLVVNFVLCAVP